MKTFQERLDFVVRFCYRRAGTNNRQSTRELCNCIETDDSEKLLAELVKKANRSSKLRSGVQLMFTASSLETAAKKYGVRPLTP